MSMRVSLLDTPRCQGGESPLWDTAEQSLYFIDNSGRSSANYSAPILSLVRPPGL